jgi:hypothetical protein
MFDQATHVDLLYVGDAVQLLLFVVGLASFVEFLAKRSLARLFVAVAPRQLAVFIFAQLAVLLIALVGFKFVVLSGGPGIATRRILKSGSFTRGFSAVSFFIAFAIVVIGMTRLFRVLRRVVVLDRH